MNDIDFKKKKKNYLSKKLRSKVKHKKKNDKNLYYIPNTCHFQTYQKEAFTFSFLSTFLFVPQLH